MATKPFTAVESTHPLYRRSRPVPQDPARMGNDSAFIDLTNAHLPPFGTNDPVTEAARRFDARAAAAVAGAVGTINADAMRFIPSGGVGGRWVPSDPFGNLLETKTYGGEAPDVRIPTTQALAVIAYPEYFPGEHDANSFRMVSEAILAANPGWCGSFGPGVDGSFDLLGDTYEGNYDMSQMHLLQIAYRYYDDLTPPARELLISQLLARGRIHRPRLDDTFTSEGTPNDWSRAGFISPLGIHFRVGETENHILMILTARYLTNQLLYQRSHDPKYDNRRNGEVMKGPHCTELLLTLLCNILRDDFSEYNAKNYQTHTRYALLNLCSYAYDHEVRLAARMVLDYVSAHAAVSSSDLRRMVPFRRRNETKNVTRDENGYMQVSLLEMTAGADPMAQHFAMLAGNTRIYQTRNWRIKADESDGNDAVMYAVSGYRLPPSVHDLFVNDAHRRFYQRLHRVPQDDPEVTGRNCDNQEIYAGSPSYLISAGGAFATWAIDPGPVSLNAKLRQKNDQQLGVAVPTSFMPTLRPQMDCGDPTLAEDLIQFGRFSDVEGVAHYGVAPDFACGPQVHLPAWCKAAMAADSDPSFGKFEFVNRESAGDGPGFFLAFLRDGNFAVMEAFDTWKHPNVMTFEQFRKNVFAANKGLMERGLHSGVREQYLTQNGNRVTFVIWSGGGGQGANVEGVDTSHGLDAGADGFGEAGRSQPARFLNGTVMNSREEGVVEVTNVFLGTTLRLDMRDPRHPIRVSETGEVEEAGANHEVWVDFAWQGPQEGDFFRPFNTVAAATAAVADGGVIRLMPGSSDESVLAGGKRVRLVAPVGGVRIGRR